jgi:outer membrane receptor protein involved in Fe transport
MKRFGSILASALLSSTALTWSCVSVAQEANATAESGVEEVVVRGAFIPEPKRETSEIASFISAEDLARQGDGNAALALRRVTGLSIVGDRFIYVRGLGERYSGALLNGLPLPSPEPLRRVVPLDLFPSAILESASAQKTFSPQYPGEFGGGLIEINTKAVPDQRVFEVGLSVGGNTETTWKNGLTYEGGAYDWAGFDSGRRAIPAPLQEAINASKRLNSLNFTGTELQTIGRSLVNSELWVLFEGTTPGNASFDLTYGDRYLVGDTSVGFIGSLGYDNSWRTKKGSQQEGLLGAGNQLEVGDDFSFFSTQNDVTWHALLGLGADTDTAEYKLTSLYIRNTTKEARVLQGDARQFNAFTREEFLEWFERQMWTNQADVKKRFADDKLLVNVKGSYSLASREAPYERTVQYRDFGDGFLRYDAQRAQNLTRFSSIDDTLKSGAVDLTYNTVFNGREVILKGGYAYSDTDRESQQRDYRLLPLGGPLPPDLLLSRIDYVFADQNINPNRFVLTEITGSASPPAYLGSLETHGVYVGTDAKVLDYVRAALGVRYESGMQTVDTYDYYLPNPGIDTVIDKGYWLPAGTVTWNFAENMQVRLGASKTIARPQFREIAPTDFIDVDTDRKFIGNPNLINSTLMNYDARWEWYFADQQYVTLGGFYKDITRPIEETVDAAGDNLRTTFQNVPRASLWGIEAEVKYVFDTSGMEGWLSTKNFFVSSNYTFSESKIKLKAGDTVAQASGLVVPAELVVTGGRPLQGHSKHLFNIQVGMEDVESGLAATLLLNYSSKRIRAVGAGGPGSLPDIYEQPPLTLDLTVSRPVEVWGGEYELGLEVENILGSKYEATQRLNGARVDVDTYDLGQSISLSIKRRF